MNAVYQEQLALGIVLISFVMTGYRILCFSGLRSLANPLASWLLKRGKVKWAMRVRKFSLLNGCTSGGCVSSSCQNS